MKIFLLSLSFVISLSSLAISRKFIKTIDHIKIQINKDELHRGNKVQATLVAVTGDGFHHTPSNSKKLDLNDFEIFFNGNCKLISKDKKRFILRLDKNFDIGEFEISAFLKKNEGFSIHEKYTIRDYRKEVVSIRINAGSVKAGYRINPTFVVGLIDGEKLTINRNSSKLYPTDFNYTVSGAGSLISSNGQFRVDENAIENPFVDLSVSLKSNENILAKVRYPVNFNVNYSLDFSANSGRRGASGEEGRDGTDGRNFGRFDPNKSDYCHSSYGGEDGRNGRRGRSGYAGYNGANGENFIVDVSIVQVPALNDSLLKIVVTSLESGSTYTRIVDRNNGSVAINANGGSGGRGGDGGNGGDGGDGGKGKYASTDEPEEGWGGDAGNSGDGGAAGNGGRGGDGGNVVIRYTQNASQFIGRVKVSVDGGQGGRAGSKGRPGTVGCEGRGGRGKGKEGERGYYGRAGYNGQAGRNGNISYQMIN